MNKLSWKDLKQKPISLEHNFIAESTKSWFFQWDFAFTPFIWQTTDEGNSTDQTHLMKILHGVHGILTVIASHLSQILQIHLTYWNTDQLLAIYSHYPSCLSRWLVPSISKKKSQSKFSKTSQLPLQQKAHIRPQIARKGKACLQLSRASNGLSEEKKN